MKKEISTGKKVLFAFLSLLVVLVLVVAVYLSYVIFSYSRIEDNTVLTPVLTGSASSLETNKNYSAYIHNIGFGAYTDDFTFFMDGGKQSRAESEESVKECVNKAIEKASAYGSDFIMLQEVDFDSTRSYHIDQHKMITDAFSNYSSVFAVNYNSAFLMYPLGEPHGASKSGMLTLSAYNVSSALRRSLPVSEGFSKFLDLDRCYSVSRIPVKNGRELVLYNVHMSAYGGSSEIRAAQMNMLFSDMQKEYERGNYCVTGGDFNHDFTGDSNFTLNGDTVNEYGWAQPFPDYMMPDCIVRCIDYKNPKLVPTCRNCDVPYVKGNIVFIVDGFLVSENVKVVSVCNIDTGFEFSDHNPVRLEFMLRP